MTWEGEQIRKVNEENRRLKVIKYGEKVVAAWEDAIARYPLILANYHNVEHLLYRDGYDDGPPPYPNIEEIASKMQA